MNMNAAFAKADATVDARAGVAVTLVAQIAGEFGSTADPNRPDQAVIATFATASEISDRGSSGRYGGRALASGDEFLISPLAAGALAWRPRVGDRIVAPEVLTGTADMTISSVLPGQRGALRLLIDRRRAAVGAT